MLVLSRKEKQTILVGDDIEITICRVSGRRVTIGLRAPSDVSIRRGEVLKHDPTVAGTGTRGLISRLARVRRGPRRWRPLSLRAVMRTGTDD